MPQGDIKIIEFTGRVANSKQETVATHLLVIDGHHHRKYGNPNFQYLPKEWRTKYLIGSLEVGEAKSWKEFYGLCTRRFEAEDPVAGTDPEGSASKRSSGKRSVTTASSEKESRPRSRASDPAGQQVSPSREPGDLADLPREVQDIFHELLDEPLERPMSLRYEMSGYLMLLSARSGELTDRDRSIARSLADRLPVLLDHVTEKGLNQEAFRLVQAAIRYFTVAEDAIPDSIEGGFDDDAEVFNMVASRLDRPDLAISLANNPPVADE